MTDKESIVQWVFNRVARGLLRVARMCGMTYNEVNVVGYYFVVPLSWALLLDGRLKMSVRVGAGEWRLFLLTILYMAVWVGIVMAVGRRFRSWCDAVFMRSVVFLNYFNRWGGNYKLNSVVICVVIPLAVYGWLIFG